MDQILSSLLVSDQPDTVKRQLVAKLAGLGPQTEDPILAKAIFKTTTGFILDAELQLSADLCKKVYVKWAKYYREPLGEFFDAEFVEHLFDDKFCHPINVVWLLHETFLLLRGTDRHAHLAKIVEIKSIDFVRDHPQDDVLTAFCKFLFEFKECIPKNEHTSTFCVAMVHAVSAFSAPTDGTLMRQFIFNVTSAIGTFIRHIWHNSAPECVMHCLKAIFTLISYVDETGTEPCIALAGLMSHIPVDLIEKVVKVTVADTTIADVNMAAALLRVIDWLSWPVASNIDHWIIAFLRELAIAHKYTILVRVTELKIEQVYLTLDYRAVRERTMTVISHMLLSFQHSPEVFHKVVHRVPHTVQTVRAEGGPESVVFLDKFSELLHCLMALHPGFPELYDTVVDSIKDYKKPSAEVIHLRLTQNKWSFQHKSSNVIGFSTRFAKKSETGKTGLGNLGNTCYMNSVLQALFICDGFRREIIRSPISPQQPLLINLQHVFAHLAMTQRAAYSPSEFLKTSRPPWFTVGHQQDCSEFLRYLLDQMDEQEVNIIRSRTRAKTGNNSTDTSVQSSKHTIGDGAVEETLIRHTFGGKMRTTSRCLKCRMASSRMEDFTDIPLAFPNQNGYGTQTDGTGKAALAGGAMSVSPTTTGCGVDTGTASLHLEDLIQYYLKPELLQGDNRYQCETCGGLQEAERSQSIIRPPEVLLLTLLRFAYNIKTQSRSKIFTDVTCPKTIHIPVTSGDSSPVANTPRSKSAFYMPPVDINHETYCLYSVVVHSGTSSECGHYYCYGRHAMPTDTPDGGENGEDYLSDRWYLFNDSRVTFSSYTAFSNVTKKFAKDTIYLLLYKRIPHGQLPADLAEPLLRKDLRDAVERDNKLFLQEQELEGRTRALQKKASANAAAASSWKDRWKDDDRSGPPGSCGGGGGFDLSGSRFVF